MSNFRRRAKAGYCNLRARGAASRDHGKVELDSPFRSILTSVARTFAVWVTRLHHLERLSRTPYAWHHLDELCAQFCCGKNELGLEPRPFGMTVLLAPERSV